MKVPIQVLFFFENKDRFLIEVKRLGLTETKKNLLYHWLFFDKASGQFQKLKFVSMESGHRKFKCGELDFDEQQGVFSNEKKSDNFVRCQNKCFPQELLGRCYGFLG